MTDLKFKKEGLSKLQLGRLNKLLKKQLSFSYGLDTWENHLEVYGRSKEIRGKDYTVNYADGSYRSIPKILFDSLIFSKAEEELKESYEVICDEIQEWGISKIDAFDLVNEINESSGEDKYENFEEMMAKEDYIIINRLQKNKNKV